MNRRKFTTIASLGAVALSTTGFVRFNGTSFEGDCETTTDILGPFYRPNSPVRNNLAIKGAPGVLVELKGMVTHDDCVSTYKGAKIELWHCSADEVYDNSSDEFRYRGTTYCNEIGKYHFTTQMPVPYDAGGGNYRPAHFHLLISAPGYQSLVTQLYFTGDPYLASDASSSSPTAKARILPVESDGNGKKTVTFNIVMREKLLVEPAAIDKLVGTYVFEGREDQITFFNNNGQLWMKNEVFGKGFDYLGNNTFEYPGRTSDHSFTLTFELLNNGSVQLKTTTTQNGKKRFKIARKEI